MADPKCAQLVARAQLLRKQIAAAHASRPPIARMGDVEEDRKPDESTALLEQLQAVTAEMERLGCSETFVPEGPKAITPKFLLVNLIYAPPGIGSSVSYGIGSTAGVTVDTSKNFKVGFSVAIETNVVNLEGGYSATTKDGKTVEVRKGASSAIGVESRLDEVAHDKDVFVLWMNPQIDLTQTGPTAVRLALKSQGGLPMRAVTVTADELRDPSLLTGSKQMALAVLAPEDRQQLLALNPFQSNQPLDSSRFRKIETIQLDGPDHADDPIVTRSLELENEMAVGTVQGKSQTGSLKVQIGGEVAFFIRLSVKAGFEFEWEFEESKTETTGSVQRAELELRSETVGFSRVFDVYYDAWFDTFAFVQRGGLRAISAAALQGILVDENDRTIADRLVTVRLAGGSRQRTFTNGRGEYKFFDVPPGQHSIEVGSAVQTLSVPVEPTVANLHFHESMRHIRTVIRPKPLNPTIIRRIPK